MAADAKTMDPVLRYCAIGRQLGYATYLSLDAVTYVSILKKVAVYMEWT